MSLTHAHAHAHAHPRADAGARAPLQRRRYVRETIQCRARIQIGLRQYAGYLHDISRGGAKLRMISPVRRVCSVVLRLPDLPPLRCKLEWMNSYNAGLSFELALPAAELAAWIRSRKDGASRQLLTEALLDEPADALCA